MRAITGATNRTLTPLGAAAVVVIFGTQGVIFAIWGNDGDPPDAAVAVAFVLFWGAVLLLLTVVVLAVRRRRHRA